MDPIEYKPEANNQFGMIPLDSDQDELKKPEVQVYTNFENPVAKEEKAQKDHRIWEVGYYQPYFDVDTATVIYRVKKAILPFSSSTFFEDKLPDLYCPF